ncbi:putative protein kinase RLK-Pelle-CrRLK1L-1 family [Helianthus annuus]|nr:putative protein kinase RLK-Pelle-CrRLK1L-1 family [Helianthus annuus]
MRGGYGMLYNGKIQYHNRHKKVVVKRFSPDRYLNGVWFSSEHGFLKEFEVLFKYKHENIIGIVGYCKEMNEKIIVYENASKGSLDRYLNSTKEDVVIHRDIKSSNILLTKNWKAKISGFELALTHPTNEVVKYVMNHVVGSPGYCDPMYWETHILTKESDMYSFGVVLFEILCGRLACPKDFKNSSQFLDILVKRHFQVARLDDIVFEGIREQIAPKSLSTFRRIAFQCLNEERKERPTASQVMVQLQKALEFQVSLIIC